MNTNTGSTQLYGPVMVRANHFPKAHAEEDRIPRHKHHFPHVTVPLIGGIHASCPGLEGEFWAPTWARNAAQYDNIAWQCGNLFIRTIAIEKKGTTVSLAAEPYDTTIILFTGEIETTGQTNERIGAPSPYVLLAAHYINITTLSDEVILWRVNSAANAEFLGLKEVKAHNGWEYPNSSHVLIRADVEHTIIALEDNSLSWCMYSHRAPDGRVTQRAFGGVGDFPYV